MALSELVGKVLAPVTAKRGFAAADLVAAWPEIVGQRFADCSRPERIVWPRGAAREGDAGILELTVEGPRAIYVQHEADQIIERVNAFLGYAAIGALRIVQRPVAPARKAQLAPPRRLDAGAEAQLAETVAGVADDGLRAALERLGRGVLTGAASSGRGRQSP